MDDKENFGFSDYTIYKQLHLGAILRKHLNITRAIFEKHDWPEKVYHYLDLHAGPGIYQHNGMVVRGSPIIFIETLMSVGLKCQAVFFEICDDRRTQLVWNLARFADVPDLSLLFHGDYQRFLPCHFDDSQARAKKKFGLVYADPAGTLPPFELLAQMFQSRSYATMDVLIYMSSTNLKRQLKYDRCPIDKRLKDYLGLIPKKYWIVREPYGPHQWTFLIGTNWDAFPEFRDLGFHRIDSPEGQEIFHRLNYTRKELAE